jgi:hypothetical protein
MYNPFGLHPTRLHELTEAHLNVLVTERVSEGYWVEYKQAFPDNRKVAKSIASFANTYGGWFFVGIEASSADNVATQIAGFSLDQVQNPIDRLREVVKSHIDPIPLFHITLVRLSTGNAVLVVYVPGEQETPFVHKDGRIYRRVADSSDPIAETNRYAVDRLVDNGRSVTKAFERFCNDERTFSQGDNGGWVNVYLSPYPLYPYFPREEDSLAAKAERYQALSLEPFPILLPDGALYGNGNIPFDTVQSTANSVVLRQVTPGLFVKNSIETELYFDGRAKFLIPLPYLPKWDTNAIKKVQSGAIKEELIPLWMQADEISLLDFFSVERLWSTMMVMLTYHWHWFTQEITPYTSPSAEFSVAVHGYGLWRSVAFLDSDIWAGHIQKFGLPVMTRDTFRFPRQGDKVFQTSMHENGLLWMLVNGLVLREFGLPDNLIGPVINAAIAESNRD